jgi:hypothetical protein
MFNPPRVTRAKESAGRACRGKRVDFGMVSGRVIYQQSGNEKKPCRVEYSPCLRLSAAKRLCISPLLCVLSSHKRDHPADQ